MLSIILASGASLAQPSFTVREDGTILRDGEGFFPMGFYLPRGSVESYRERVQSLADAGAFNIINLPYVAGDDDAWAAFLDLCAANGIYVVTQLYYSGQFIGPVRSFRSHPAVFGWSTADDADDGHFSLDQLAERNRAIKAADPDNPTELSLTGYYKKRRDDVRRFTPLADIVAYQSYPITPFPDYDVTPDNALTQSYLRTLHYVTAADELRKPMIINSQTFAWGEPAPEPRFPTALEFRNMTYSQLAAGIKGIIAYEYNDELVAQDTLWRECRALRRDVSGLEPALLDGALTRVATDDADLVMSYWQHEQEITVVVVNTSYSEAKAVSLTLPAAQGTFRHLFERLPNTLTFNDGVVEGTIAPTQVEVCQLRLAGASSGHTDKEN